MSAPTIERYERGGDANPLFNTVRSIRRALERGGVVFLEPTDEHGAGIAMRVGKVLRR